MTRKAEAAAAGYTPRGTRVDIAEHIARCREIKAAKAALKAEYQGKVFNLERELRAREQTIRRALTRQPKPQALLPAKVTSDVYEPCPSCMAHPCMCNEFDASLEDMLADEDQGGDEYAD